jgi:hypothetical protein
MGKYTSLARKVEESRPQKNAVDRGLNNTYKHSMVVDTGGNTAAPLSESGTNLRTTNLTNLTEVPCIHGHAEDACAVCSGYVRWLAEDEDRLRAAQTNPGAVRREFWRAIRSES